MRYNLKLLKKLARSLFNRTTITYSYSAPERRHPDNSPLPFIPNEIYLEIFQYFDPTQRDSESECYSILANLTLVCRFFHAICIPRIFETYTFQLATCMFTPAKSRRIRLGKVFKNRKIPLSLASYVETCRFSAQWSWPGVFSAALVNPANVMQHAKVVSRFQNLESLYLTHTPITQPFFVSVIAKSSLKSISIIQCKFLPLEREWNFDFFQPRWSSMHIAECMVDMDAYVIPLSRLASSQNLQTCIVDRDDLADAIFSRPVQFNHLRDLRVHMPSTLHSFLIRTPSIVTLHWRPRFVDSFGPLPPGSLPSIQEVSSSRFDHHLVQDLITRPSLRAIRFYPVVNDQFKVAGEWLQRANSSVECLTIPLGLYRLFPLGTTFPVLDKLELLLGSRRLEFAMEELCVSGLSHPQVRLLVFDNEYPNPVQWLNLQHQNHCINVLISKAFPQTKKIRFMPYFEWYMKDSRWKVEVIGWPQLKQCINYFATLGIGTVAYIEDFDGVLVKMYDEEELRDPTLRSVLRID